MAERKILEASEPFSVTLQDGTPYSVATGDRFYSDDPVVRGREKLFGELQVRSSRPTRPVSSPAVETASADPGEKRSVTSPPGDDLDALRTEAEKAGVKVDKRWGADKLRQEIAAKAKGKE